MRMCHRKTNLSGKKSAHATGCKAVDKESSSASTIACENLVSAVKTSKNKHEVQPTAASHQSKGQDKVPLLRQPSRGKLSFCRGQATAFQRSPAVTPAAPRPRPGRGTRPSVTRTPTPVQTLQDVRGAVHRPHEFRTEARRFASAPNYSICEIWTHYPKIMRCPVPRP